MKTNMKKLFSILLVVIMVIGLSACGDQNNDGNNVVDDVEDGVNDVVDGVENGVNDMLGNGNNGNDNSTADRNKVTVDDITVTLKQDDTDMSGYTKTHELGETDGTYTAILTSNKDMKNVTVFAGVEGVLHMTDRSDEATLISKDDAVVLHLAEGENITVSVEIDGAAKGYTISVDNNGQLDVRAAAEGWENTVQSDNNTNVNNNNTVQ